jgi:hypothetical protein
MSKYEESSSSFLSSHQDLIGEYENIEGIIPLEYCEIDVADLYTNLLKIDKSIKYVNALEDALKYAIKYNTSIIEGFEMLTSSIVAESQSNNSIQQYFKEINDIYNKHDNNYDIEYCPENRDKLIEMNLKTVISIAKKYQGLGLSLSELISAGNLGLVIAWDKFDPSRSELKDNILIVVDSLNDEITFNELNDAVKDYMSYGDIKRNLMKNFYQTTLIKKPILLNG